MERMEALYEAKRYIETNLDRELGLKMVQVPLIVDRDSGLNDYLDRDGSRTPVEFDCGPPDVDSTARLVGAVSDDGGGLDTHVAVWIAHVEPSAPRFYVVAGNEAADDLATGAVDLQASPANPVGQPGA